MEKKKGTLGEYLRSIRELRTLTLRQVEEKTGVSNAYVSQVESGRVKQPSPTVLYQLATLYEVPYESLMEKAGYPVPKIGASGAVSQTMFARFGALSEQEEDALVEYLAFLRTRAKKSRGKK